MEQQNKVPCPACTTDINGEYWNCSECGNTGTVSKKEAKRLQDNAEFFNQIMFENRLRMQPIIDQ